MSGETVSRTPRELAFEIRALLREFPRRAETIAATGGVGHHPGYTLIRLVLQGEMVAVHRDRLAEIAVLLDRLSQHEEFGGQT